MIPFARRMLMSERSRLAITISAVAIMVMQMLFLGGIYQGVKLGAIGYVQHSNADLWICQNNSRNLLRSTSFMRDYRLAGISQLKGVRRAEAILKVIATARIHGKEETMFVFGLPPEAAQSQPMMVAGNGVPGEREIIIDRSFARKFYLKIGDTLSLQDMDYRVTGISRETNATITQFSFVSLNDAQELLGFRGIISFILAKVDKSADLQTLRSTIKTNYPELSVFDRETFIENSLREMQSGILPLFWTIFILSVFSGILVITLMFYQSVIEMRDDYALLMAIGARPRYLASLILKQTLTVTFCGFIGGTLLELLLIPALEKMVPVLNVMSRWEDIAVVFVLSLGIGSAGSVFPIRKLRSIYPAEVFRV
jgi:putative ABC transport system permease protein